MGSKDKMAKEGTTLLGSPTFSQIVNGRFRCIETGHEFIAKDMESYSQSKRCRSGLIDFALSQNTPPLNMFRQDPLSRSRLICKLTGDTVNKNEEHIWKHINGKRFLNRLEQMNTGNQLGETLIKGGVNPSADGAKTKKKKGKEVAQIRSEMRDYDGSDSDEPEFWMPPGGELRNFDEGRCSVFDSDQDRDDENEKADDVYSDSEELTARTKRMSIEIGPSSFASRKKKSKKSVF